MSERCSQWNKDSELLYWDAESDEYYLNRLKTKYDNFSVNALIYEYFAGRPIRNVFDIGGGKFGGALYFYKGEGKKVLIDVLGNEFVARGKIPPDVLVCVSDFIQIPFVDESADIVFAWEVLDHALTWSHFQHGQKELARLLAPGGLLFFHVPIRVEPDSLHIATPNADEIMLGFPSLKVINDLTKRIPRISVLRDQVFTVLTKDIR
jgi:SAM-dependent methyltransferase